MIVLSEAKRGQSSQPFPKIKIKTEVVVVRIGDLFQVRRMEVSLG